MLEKNGRASTALRRRRVIFLTVLMITAALEGAFLGYVGADLGMLALVIVMTIVAGIGWMRAYWDAA
jgi:hypothetical protein